MLPEVRANGAKVISPGHRPGYACGEDSPLCKGGRSLRPLRAHHERAIPIPRALPWAKFRRRFQRRKKSTVSANGQRGQRAIPCDSDLPEICEMDCGRTRRDHITGGFRSARYQSHV